MFVGAWGVNNRYTVFRDEYIDIGKLEIWRKTKMSAFDNATLMITGGTGSFGSTVLKHFLDSDLKEIRIFSRDEKKQDDMRHELQAKHPDTAKKNCLRSFFS